MTTSTLSSGVSSTGLTIGSGDELIVLAGGSAISTTLSGGGFDVVSSGGFVSFTTIDAGSVESVGVGGSSISATVNNGGDEFLFSGNATGTTVNAGGSAVVFSAAEATDITVNSGGVEILAGGTATDTTLNTGGALNLVVLNYAPGGTASVDSTGMLTVSDGGGIYQQQLAGDYAANTYVVTSQFEFGSDYGVLVTAEVPCFHAGTRILTARGEVAVENLRIGDRVRTLLGTARADGTELDGTGPSKMGAEQAKVAPDDITAGNDRPTEAPITWVGRRDVECAGHPKPRQVWPVRIAAGAFGPGQPHSNLLLSPDHAVYVNGVLIPVKHLINGSTITQVPTDRVTYYHIELPQHDVVVAEGLPAESFLDMKDGSNYANRRGPVRLYPDFSARMWEAFGCARLVVTGPELAAARAVVASFAGQQAAA